MNYKFSIIIPAHHEYGSIGKCLDSIFNQTYKNFEVIVVLDNAPPELEAAVQNYPVSVYRVCYNRPGPTRNEGLKHATGDYVGFVDCDDYIPSEDVLEEINSQLTEDLDELVGDNNIGGDIRWQDVVVWNRVGKLDFIRRNNIHFPDAFYDEDACFNKDSLLLLHKSLYIHNEKPYYCYNRFHAGSISGMRYYRNTIGFAFEGCGKTYAAHQDLHWLDIDTTRFPEDQYPLLLQLILDETMKNFYGVFLSCDEKFMRYIMHFNIPINIIMPNSEMKEEILERIKYRDGENNNNYLYYRDNYDSIYNTYAMGPNANIYYISKGEVVSMYLPQLNRMNDHFFRLCPGYKKS